MTMHVVFLKDYEDHEIFSDGFIPRPLGRKLVDDGTVVPYMNFIRNEKEYRKPKRGRKKKKAVSKKAERREQAITT